jgi:hypothetical protein
MEVTEGVARYFARERGGARRHASPSARTGLDIYGGNALWVRLLRNDDPALCCSRNTSAERQTTSESWRSCLASGLFLRQIMPMVREGCGFLKRATDTDAERASTAVAISGINVTPMPALTIWTSVDRELASSMSRGSADFMLQNDSA